MWLAPAKREPTSQSRGRADARRLTQALTGSVMNTARAIAEYVLALEHAAATTTRAEDRPSYAALLADAAPLLAVAISAPKTPSLSARAQRHERLWGNLWLNDPTQRTASLAWQAAKAVSGYGAV